MGDSWGRGVRVTVFGESHGAAVGVSVEGLPAGMPLDMDALRATLRRRAPGGSAYASARREADEPELLAGVYQGRLTGGTLACVFRNGDARSGDYAPDAPRPGHADLTGAVRHFGFNDPRGGGHFSGRLTLPVAFAGALCAQALAREGVRVCARLLSVGGVADDTPLVEPRPDIADEAIPALDPGARERMAAAILAAKADGDSLGGVVECACFGVPAGLGEPFFDSVESEIASLLFSIPGVKGVEFGMGFAAAAMRGSRHNDGYRMADGRVEAETNRAGGVLGGVSTGQTIAFRCAFKPTPSVAAPQRSVSLSRGEDVELRVAGRHDPCIAPRAVPVVEAAAALALADLAAQRRMWRDWTKGRV